MHTTWAYRIRIAGAHVCLCVRLLYPEEVNPSGLFNRHQLPILLQEMDAADYYQRIHKFFMGKLKL